MKTRKAVKKDISQLNKLSDELHRHMSEVSGIKVSKKEMEDEHVQSEKEFREDNFYVAEKDGKIAGCIIFGKKVEYNEWRGRYLPLHHLIISKKHQGEGIGKELFNVMKKIAAKKKVNIVADTSIKNKSAIGFYERLGFRPFEVTLLWKHKQ